MGGWRARGHPRAMRAFLAILLLSSLPVRAQDVAPRVVEGAAGDMLRIAPVPGPRGGSGVEVCLEAGPGVTGPIGFDAGRAGPPRHVTGGNRGPVCARLTATRHRLTFWRGASDGTLRRVLEVSVDLSGEAGQGIGLLWLRRGG